MEYLGQNIPKLGFGFMRLPLLENKDIDIEQVKKMVDIFMERGFTYFDTAFVYHNGLSEPTLGEALVKRYPRNSFQLATKMSLWKVNSEEELDSIFAGQLERLNTDYIDYYLIHSLTEKSIPRANEYNVWEFVARMKAEGKVKHWGFSFHSTPEVLEELLCLHPEAEFVQIQMNYNDWDNEDVQARRCYEVIRKHGKAVIIMEPVRGGSLAKLPPKAHAIFQALKPGSSDASWAIRWCASHEGLITVLSGMSNIEQVEDNTNTMQNFIPLNEIEFSAVRQVKSVLDETPLVPCTGCEYCVSGCPQSIMIPQVIEALNDYRKFTNLETARFQYRFATQKGKASACISCGACTAVCPQHLPIPELMHETAEQLEQ